ncbi:MAG: hypothetical protein ACXWL2_03235 [Candidatus Chromulinivorax sp.]
MYVFHLLVCISILLPVAIQSMHENLRLCVQQVRERAESDESIGKTQLTNAMQSLQNHMRVFISSSQFKKDYRYPRANDLYQALKNQRDILREESLTTKFQVIGVAQAILENLQSYEKNSQKWTACVESPAFQNLKNVCCQSCKIEKS